MLRGNGPVFRMLLVGAIGAGLAVLAVRSAKPGATEASIGQDRPLPVVSSPVVMSPVVMAISMDSPLPEHCLVPPREDKDQQPAAQKTGDRSGQRARKKIIACG